MAFKINKKSAGYIIAGAGLLIAIGVIWYFASGDSDNDGNGDGDGDGTPPGKKYCANPATLDNNKVLKRGMPKNPEVCNLQKLLGVGQDGVFGVITEGALYNKIGKNETTLFKYTACVKAGVC